jgi:dihydrofolate reductase
MERKNSVFIATSLDGFIADSEGGIEWLDAVPNTNQTDMGYDSFMNRIDALVMGRNTYEKVLSFNIPWPYRKPVFVWSKTLNQLPEELDGKVELINGKPKEILEILHQKGFGRLYIDGGQTVQAFLKDDLIDEMIITKIPVVLGSGFSLFGELPTMLPFSLVNSKVFLDQIVQDTYIRKR